MFDTDYQNNIEWPTINDRDTITRPTCFMKYVGLTMNNFYFSDFEQFEMMLNDLT